MTLPTTAKLEAEIERLVARCSPYVDPTGAIHRIRALQHAASTAPTTTRGGAGAVVFDLDAYRRRHDDDPPPEAA